jgi:hypothetical protein
VTRHGQFPAKPEVALQATVKLAAMRLCAIPPARSVPVSTTVNEKNSPIAVPGAGNNARRQGQSHFPGAPTKPSKFDKTP